MNNPAEDLLRISMSHALPRCLHAVAELNVADALGDSPRTSAELAKDTSTNPDALARVLRVLSAEGIFESRDGSWVHTPASRLLRSDHPQSMRSFVRMIGLDVYWRGFEYMEDSIRTGKSIQEKVVPGGYWEYLGEHPEAAQLFDEAMMGKAYGQIAGVLNTYDFSGFHTIVDVGGGRGHLALRRVGSCAENTRSAVRLAARYGERASGGHGVRAVADASPAVSSRMRCPQAIVTSSCR